MARIRTIKPEFWTSEQVVECSRDARLMFIGIWNFSDDHGIHPAKPRSLKMRVFPGDDDIASETISGLIDELKKNNLIYEYVIENEHYWIVGGWSHQRIDKPSYKYPEPTEDSFLDGSPITLDLFDDSSPAERKGKESKGKEGKESKKFIPPEKQEVIDYFLEKGYSLESAEKAFDYYHETNWKDSSGKQVLSWKQKMQGVWFKPENKLQPSQSQTRHPSLQ